jgi:hypothetical protein
MGNVFALGKAVWAIRLFLTVVRLKWLVAGLQQVQGVCT